MFGSLFGLCVLGMVGVVFGRVQDRIGSPGTHRVRLDSVLEITNAIGLAFQWIFRVVDGEPDAGCVFTVITGREMRGGTSLGDLLDSLYGRKLAAGELVDPIGDFVDAEFQLVAKRALRSSGGVFHAIRPFDQKRRAK
jgi:hypothetical protein